MSPCPPSCLTSPDHILNKVFYPSLTGPPSVRIARILSLEERTVVSHRQHIMDKVGIRSVAGLTKYAVRQGITSLK